MMCSFPTAAQLLAVEHQKHMFDFELRIYVPLYTKVVISETFFPASLLAGTEETEPNATKANIHPEHKNTLYTK